MISFFREIQNDQTVPNHREAKSKVRKTTWHAAETRGKPNHSAISNF